MRRPKMMKLIQLYLPPEYIRDLDLLVKQRLYANRSQCIRVAVADLLKEEVWRTRKT